MNRPNVQARQRHDQTMGQAFRCWPAKIEVASAALAECLIGRE